MKFRKKPVLIEAFQMTRERRADNSEWPEWLHRAWNFERGEPGAVYPVVSGTDDGQLTIATLEGAMVVGWDDWIIQGVKGELYPCKPDVFEASYDEFKINKQFDGMTAAEVDSLSDGYERASLVVAVVDDKVEVLKDRHGPYRQPGLARAAIDRLLAAEVDAAQSEERIAGVLGPEKYARTLPVQSERVAIEQPAEPVYSGVDFAIGKEPATIEEASWAVGCVNGQVRVLKDRSGALGAHGSHVDIGRLAAIVIGTKKAPPVYVVLTGPGPHQEFVECETAAGEGVRVGVAPATEEGRVRLGPFWERPPFAPRWVKWRIDEHNDLTLWDVFNGIGIQTDQGRIGIAQRDSGIEVVLDTPGGQLLWSSTTAWGNDPQSGVETPKG